jgi:hypothetical protein
LFRKKRNRNPEESIFKKKLAAQMAGFWTQASDFLTLLKRPEIQIKTANQD